MLTNVWTIVGLHGVDLCSTPEVALASDLSLCKATPSLLAAGDLLFMSKVQHEVMQNCPCFLVQRTACRMGEVPDANTCYEALQDALMAFQIVKPVETDGFFFLGEQSPAGSLSWHGTQIRWPMSAGQWARMRTFDPPLIAQLKLLLGRVRRVMTGTNITKKNAVHLLQMALEHPHPYIACLLAVTGMEAIFDSANRWDFEEKLCDSLGASNPAFPDWNSPELPPLNYTVEELAVHLYTLRSKIAHGAELSKAAHDKNSPVDLLQLRDYIPEADPVLYALLLGEAAVYLLGQVLQKVL